MITNFLVTLTDPVFVRNHPTGIDLSFTYHQLDGAPILRASNTHNITITATDVDLRTNISQTEFDTLHVVTSAEADLDVAIDLREVTNVTISVRY